jgi:hypothetical protein
MRSISLAVYSSSYLSNLPLNKKRGMNVDVPVWVWVWVCFFSCIIEGQDVHIGSIHSSYIMIIIFLLLLCFCFVL